MINTRNSLFAEQMATKASFLFWKKKSTLLLNFLRRANENVFAHHDIHEITLIFLRFFIILKMMETRATEWHSRNLSQKPCCDTKKKWFQTKIVSITSFWFTNKLCSLYSMLNELSWHAIKKLQWNGIVELHFRIFLEMSNQTFD